MKSNWRLGDCPPMAFLLRSRIRSSLPLANLPDEPGVEQFLQGFLDHRRADVWTDLQDVALGDLPRRRLKDRPDAFAFRLSSSRRVRDTILKFTVGLQDHAEQITDERTRIVRALMPHAGTVPQSLVIGLLGFFDQHLKADVFSDDIPRLIQEQQRQESAHASVPVAERMNTEEIQDKDRRDKERIRASIGNGLSICQADFVHGKGRFRASQRTEPDTFIPLRIGFGDDILRDFPMPSEAIWQMRIEISMKLKDQICRKRHKVVALVNGRQNVPVARDFILVAIPRRCLLTQQLPQSCGRGENPLNTIGCLRTLNSSHLQQGIQYISLRGDVKILFPAIFMDARQEARDFRRQQESNPRE